MNSSVVSILPDCRVDLSSVKTFNSELGLLKADKTSGRTSIKVLTQIQCHVTKKFVCKVVET